MLLITLIILGFLLLLLSNHLTIRKQIIANRMDRIYDEMEFYIIKNRIILNRNFISFMSGHKAFKINRSFADFEVLGALYMLIPANKLTEIKQNNAIIKQEHPVLNGLSEEFGKECTNLAKLNAINLGFIFRLSLYLIKSFVKFCFFHRDSFIKKAKKAVHYGAIYDS